uniref:histidine kinase N-terminal 7TM domain-containing diguanylate cyclase n=1 Tax=Trichocoleus desertorum TaxID=1481672 RepID=UPI0025B43AE7|nr:histidine kinase N-terminal 7TM domain-containing protein [Trichocoleus desertorum]
MGFPTLHHNVGIPHLNPYCYLLGLTALISLVAAYAAWQRRTTAPASKPFLLMMLAIAGYATVAALEAAATTLSSKILWSKLEYVGSGSVITLFLIFATHFTHRKNWLTPKTLAWLWVVPILNVILVMTNSWHRWVWTGFLWSSASSNLLIYQHGPGFFWIMACVYAYTLAGAFLLLKAALRPSLLYRRQAIMALASAMIPLIGGSAYMLNLTPPGLNITPMSFMLSGLIYSANLFRFQLFDLVPVARDTLVESMSDGVLVLDQQNRVVDINPAARELLGTTVACVGQPAAKSLWQWQDIARRCYDSGDHRLAIAREGKPLRYIELRTTPLRDRTQQLTGRLIVLRDVTERHQAELDLQQANQRLQNQLLEIEVLQTQLREQAVRDILTGLFNRRYLEETFHRELARATRESYLITVALLDIDHFKQINDTFGHLAGDRVLQAFGELPRCHSRSSDIACRYGGEEFVLVMPQMPLDLAYRRIEKIRLAWQATLVEFGGQQIQSTFSGGVSAFPPEGRTLDCMLHLADQALYAAKAAGRNCIKQGFYQPLDQFSVRCVNQQL